MDVLSVARGSEKKQHRAPGAAQTTQSTGAGEGRCPGRAPSAGPCNGRKPEPFLSRRLGTDRPSGQRGKEEKQRLIQAWETFTGQVGPSWCHFSGDSEPTCPPLHCLLGALSHLDPGTDMSNAAVLPSPAAPPPCTAGSSWPVRPALQKSLLVCQRWLGHLTFCSGCARGGEPRHNTLQPSDRWGPSRGQAAGHGLWTAAAEPREGHGRLS